MYLTIIFLTLISALTVGFFGRFFGFHGSAIIATSCLIVAFIVSLFIFYVVIFVSFFLMKKFQPVKIKAVLINCFVDSSLIIGIILIFIYYESLYNYCSIEWLYTNYIDIITLGWSNLCLFNKHNSVSTQRIYEKLLSWVCNTYAEFISQMGVAYVSYPLLIMTYIVGFYNYYSYSIPFSLLVSNVMYFTICYILLAPILYNKNKHNNQLLDKLKKLLKKYCSDLKFQKFLWGLSYLTEKPKKF